MRTGLSVVRAAARQISSPYVPGHDGGNDAAWTPPDDPQTALLGTKEDAMHAIDHVAYRDVPSTGILAVVAWSLLRQLKVDARKALVGLPAIGGCGTIER